MIGIVIVFSIYTYFIEEFSLKNFKAYYFWILVFFFQSLFQNIIVLKRNIEVFLKKLFDKVYDPLSKGIKMCLR